MQYALHTTQSPNTWPRIPHTGSTDEHMHAAYTYKTWQTQTHTKQVSAYEGWVRHMEFEPLHVELGKPFFGLIKIFKLLKHFLLYTELKCSPSQIVLEEHASITPK